MMIDRRLIKQVPGSAKYISANILWQWIGLLANITLIFSLAILLEHLATAEKGGVLLLYTVLIATGTILVRFWCITNATRMSCLAAESVKKILREKIYRKLLKLGNAYSRQTTTSEIVQVSVEGVEQLEIYFGKYLPQLFYSLLAPLTLFAVFSFVSLQAALILLACVPLIPISIVAVQKFARKLFSRYWNVYTDLGGSLLENLQGLTTLKIYQADGFKNEEMNKQAEQFRNITMKVLRMQLNSVIFMDIIAFGGAALGVIVSVVEYQSGRIGFASCLAIILLSAEFFIPLRQLGSFFHIAINGITASGKIFRFLDLAESEAESEHIVAGETEIICKGVGFSYEPQREILRDINFAFPKGSFTALVGESGCGKSTVAALLMGINKGYSGSVKIGGKELSTLTEESIMKNITMIGHNSFLFNGTVRDNLLMGNPDATEQQLWRALQQVGMADFFSAKAGMDTLLMENAANLSGGQRQRLALARALLHDTPVYILDEITSHIDVESEKDIMDLIRGQMRGSKTIILISHRLANVIDADYIYVLEKGEVAEKGVHKELQAQEGVYARLFSYQQKLESYGMEAEARCGEAF